MEAERAEARKAQQVALSEAAGAHANELAKCKNARAVLEYSEYVRDTRVM